MARPSPGAERVVAVLEYFAAQPDVRFTLSQIARGCDLNKATTHALLTELTARGILLRHPEEKRYSLGPRLVPIGRAAQRGYQAEDFQAGALGRLAAVSRSETVAIRYDGVDDHATVVGRSGQGGEMPVPRRWPLVPPNGLVFFAWAEEPALEAWLARAPASGAVQQALAGLEAARRDGVVIGKDVPAWRRFKTALAAPDRVTTRDPGLERAHTNAVRDALADLARAEALIVDPQPEESYADAYIAAPVFDERGQVTLALVVGGRPDRPRKGDELVTVAGAARSVADELTAAVHGQLPESLRD